RRGVIVSLILLASCLGRRRLLARGYRHRARASRLETRSDRLPEGRSAGRSLPLKENHDLRGAHGPDTRHREAADDPPALSRIAVERMLQILWTELAGPPAVFLGQHLVFHGHATSLKNDVSTVFPSGHRPTGPILPR